MAKYKWKLGFIYTVGEGIRVNGKFIGFFGDKPVLSRKAVWEEDLIKLSQPYCLLSVNFIIYSPSGDTCRFMCKMVTGK